MPTYYGPTLYFPTSPTPTPGQTVADRLLWRWILTDLNGAIITFLDHLATGRSVTRNLASPSEMVASVPSDSPEINMIHVVDGDVFLDEGDRLLYGFRRESSSAPYYYVRASGLVLQVEDSTASDNSVSKFTAYDPWQYLFSLPVLKSPSAMSTAFDKWNVRGWANGRLQLLPAQGLLYPAKMNIKLMILEIISNALYAINQQATAYGLTMPVGAQYGFLNIVDGVLEDVVPGFHDPYPIAQGTSVGQALTDIVGAGVCDIVMEPFYDPVYFPGILSTLNIYSYQQAGASSHYVRDATGHVLPPPATGPATIYGFNDTAVFAWDRPGRSLAGISRIEDGSQRTNELVFFNGQGGVPVFQDTIVDPPPFQPGKTPHFDGNSISRFGVYFSQQYFPASLPGQQGITAIDAMSHDQVLLRSDHKTTVTLSPAPEFAPTPFIDYNLGDRVPVHAGRTYPPTFVLPYSMEFLIKSNQFREELSGYQRIVKIVIDIDDNGVETVTELVGGPAANPGGVVGLAGVNTAISVAVGTARIVNRGGVGTSFGGRSG